MEAIEQIILILEAILGGKSVWTRAEIKDISKLLEKIYKTKDLLEETEKELSNAQSRRLSERWPD